MKTLTHDQEVYESGYDAVKRAVDKGMPIEQVQRLI